MFEVERIEDWKGQDVVDSDGEKIGTLEDVFFEADSGEAALGAVKTGFLGRKTYLVPLEGASLTRDQVQVTHAKDRVAEGPEAPEDGRLGSDDDQRLAGHYSGYESKPDREGVRYESAEAQRERREQAAEAKEKASKLEDEAAEHERTAEELRSDADEKRERADEHSSKAGEIRRRAKELKEGK